MLFPKQWGILLVTYAYAITKAAGLECEPRASDSN